MAKNLDILDSYLGEATPSEANAPAPQTGGAAGPAPKSDDLLGSYLSAPNENGEKFSPKAIEPGLDPANPINESPLSITDRARLGWVKTPQNQKALLEHNYGAKNVQLVQKEGMAGFVVKEKDGKWYNVDPHFEWKLDAKPQVANAGKGFAMGGLIGAAAGYFAGDTLKDTGKDVAQLTGEYGLKSIAASVAGAKGAVAGAAAGATAGPWGMGIGATLGGLSAAGLAAAGAEGVDLLSRQALPDGTIGKDVTHSKEELAAQLYSSMLFGMEQEAGTGVFKLGGKATVAAFNKAVKAMSDTPTGRYLASKIVGTLTGQGEHMARIRVDNPQGVARFDMIAADDAVNNTNKLYDKMKAKVNEAFDSLSRRSRTINQQYGAVNEVASTLKYNPGEAALQLQDDLVQGGYIRKGKVVDYRNSPNVEMDIKASERQALQYIQTQSDNILEKVTKGEHVTHQEMQNVIRSIDKKLYESEAIVDQNLRRILKTHQAKFKQHAHEILHAKSPEMAAKLGELNSKFGPVKDLLDDLATKSEDQRVDALLKKIIKDDGSFEATLMTNISELLGTSDPTQEILQMHAARGSTKLWGGKKFMGIPVGSPKLGATVVTEFSDAKQGFKQLGGAVADSIPYMQETLKFLKGADLETRKKLLSNPEAVEVMMRAVGSASKMEKQQVQDLLSGSGVVQ